ncbi:MAG: TetR/AcrR family transcriptional regulator [Oscillospiraceae bacterium]|nr:TetR/AcrR family transcriptional regulator [Oscillospiraceae bacterium]
MKKGNTKERLIMAALDLFSVKGYEGTSVEEIARAVGIKAPTMYKYLKSKEELLLILIDQSEKEYDNGMKQNLQVAYEINSGSELKNYAMKLIEFTINNDMAVKMRRLLTIEQYRNEQFAESATRHHVKTIQSIFADIFRKMMDKGLMIQGDANIYALEFAAPVTLMIQMSDRQPEKKTQALETINRHFDVFIERYCINK